VLISEPLCRVCAEQGITREATDVDHIIGIEDGGEALDLDNLRPVCKSCHQRLTNQAIAARRKARAGT
jgi:5-methylcytosine-specific restriction protein A